MAKNSPVKTPQTLDGTNIHGFPNVRVQEQLRKSKRGMDSANTSRIPSNRVMRIDALSSPS
eukprot:3196487-Lingulodinium_polyedra.AAC.1